MRAVRAALRLGPWFACISAIAVPAAAEMPDGFYFGIEIGGSIAEDLTTSTSGVSHPTRCDRLLYPDPAAAPTDAACMDDVVRPLFDQEFGLGAGFVGAAGFGYKWSRVRIEVEYADRSQGGDARLVNAASVNAALTGKDSEWSAAEPPMEEVADFRSRQFFVNGYYDFPGASAWTPWVGVGIGMADTSFLYSNRFLRKADLSAELGTEPWVQNAEGSLSYNSDRLSDTLSGLQLLGGVDYALNERTVLGFKARWARFDGFPQASVWDRIRSHAPVIADGVTPFVTTADVDDIGHLAFTLGIRYAL